MAEPYTVLWQMRPWRESQKSVGRPVCSQHGDGNEIKETFNFAIGNAPTALIQLYEMLKDQRFRPEFIIGVPVGFVNVEAAKELILETEVPHIINRGRKRRQ